MVIEQRNSRKENSWKSEKRKQQRIKQCVPKPFDPSTVPWTHLVEGWLENPVRFSNIHIHMPWLAQVWTRTNTGTILKCKNKIMKIGNYITESTWIQKTQERHHPQVPRCLEMGVTQLGQCCWLHPMPFLSQVLRQERTKWAQSLRKTPRTTCSWATSSYAAHRNFKMWCSFLYPFSWLDWTKMHFMSLKSKRARQDKRCWGPLL